MSTIGGVLLLAGGAICFVTGIMILIKAFQTSVLWGLGYLFVPFVNLIFIVLHWDDTKKPFLFMLGGAVMMGLGAFLSGGLMPSTTAG